MIDVKDLKYRRTPFVRAAVVLLCVMLTLMLIPAAPAFADDEESVEEAPLRGVHKVGVNGKAYCFFVQHNVVLTPAEVAEMDDAELTAEILRRAGVYIIESNCKNASHEAVVADEWTKGELFLSEDDINTIRGAKPADGSPVKIYMDLRIAAEPVNEEGEPTIYSTFKRTGPKLLFAVVATEEDAKYGEDICEEENSGKGKKGNNGGGFPGRGGAGEEDMLPEYRTINMPDRSGEPVEDTIEEGDPVYLEWKDPGKSENEEGDSFIDHIPGRYAGLAAAVAAAAAAGFFLIKKRREEE